MIWAKTKNEATIETALRNESRLACHAPSPQLRQRTLRALEHVARSSPPSSSTLFAPRTQGRRRGLAMVVGMTAVIALAVIASVQVTPTGQSLAPDATSGMAPRVIARPSPQALADALPDGATTLVANVSMHVAVADDPLEQEATALRQDLRRALAHLRTSVGLGSSIQQ